MESTSVRPLPAAMAHSDTGCEDDSVRSAASDQIEALLAALPQSAAVLSFQDGELSIVAGNARFGEAVRMHRLKPGAPLAESFWIDRIHGETMLRTAGPDRMVHLQQVIDNDFKVKEVHARLREERSEPARG